MLTRVFAWRTRRQKLWAYVWLRRWYRENIKGLPDNPDEDDEDEDAKRATTRATVGKRRVSWRVIHTTHMCNLGS